MPKIWSSELAEVKKKELKELYVSQNLTIFEIADILSLNYRTVYDRLKKFNIKTIPYRKNNYLNQNNCKLPSKSTPLAEFFGVMFGDGHLGYNQFFITVNESDEPEYRDYLCGLLNHLFNMRPKKTKRRGKVIDVFLTSARVTRHLGKLGLVSKNKIKMPPLIPSWIIKKSSYRKAFLRGFFDTDGSIYRLRFGFQISFTSGTNELLEGIHNLLLLEGFKPSQISCHKVYLTKQSEIKRFFNDVSTRNLKHLRRYVLFANQAGVREVDKPSGL